MLDMKERIRARVKTLAQQRCIKKNQVGAIKKKKKKLADINKKVKPRRPGQRQRRALAAAKLLAATPSAPSAPILKRAAPCVDLNVGSNGHRGLVHSPVGLSTGLPSPDRFSSGS